jgi:hypothetical protein
MGSPEDVIEQAALYLRIYFCGMPIMLLYNFGSAILRAIGDTKRPLYYLTLAGVINVILNLIFVIFFHMGVAGVAVATVDSCVEQVVTAAQKNGYEVLIIADHGNADNAVNPDGTPNTAHSLNPVPCIWVTAQTEKTLRNGVLADVAPTVLEIMGVGQPAEMTGKTLIVK